MNTEKKVWEALTTEYIRKVRRALRRIDHPRKKEVLSDLQDHLRQRFADLAPDQRTPEQLEAVVREMGPPDEYGELLLPAEGPRALTLFQRRSVLWLLVSFIALTSALCLFFDQGRAIGACVRGLFGTDYLAPPFFSKKNFARVQTGMTTDQVRDMIGFPIWRYSLVGSEDKVHWVYTTGIYTGAPSVTELSVVMDKTSERVVATKRQKLRRRTDGGFPVSHADWVAGLRKKIGDLRLKGADGSERVLSGDDEDVYLIRLVGEAGHMSLQELLHYHIRSTSKEFGWLPAKGGQVIYLVERPLPENYAEVLEALNLESAAVSVSSQPVIQMTESLMVAYKEGILYELPPVFSGPQSDAWQTDQVWLVDRLIEKTA